MSLEQYAYLAGVIDCDGYITIQRTKKVKKLPSGNNCVGFYHVVKVGITGTDRGIHDFASKIFGSSVSDHQPKNELHKKHYMWQLTSSRAVDFIKKIRPYLVIKRQQADLAVRYFNDPRVKTTPPVKITVEILELRDVYWKEIVSLNSSRKNIRSRNNMAAMK